jgi:DNA-binding transcriptional LysR family regulator
MEIRADHVSAIRKLRRDVAFITGTNEWSHCETEQLWTERVFVVIPDDHSLCSREDVAGEDLEEMVDDAGAAHGQRTSGRGAVCVTGGA